MKSFEGATAFANTLQNHNNNQTSNFIETNVETLSPSNLPPVFSCYRKPILNKTPEKEINLFELYEAIKSPDYKHITGALRNIKDEKEQRDYKNKNFDYVTPSGTFVTRADSQLKTHSGIVCLDFDKLKDVAGLKESLINDPYTLLCMISPRGEGLKWFVRVDPLKNHLQNYNAVSKYAKLMFNLEKDKSCTDVSRACFLPHDADAFINSKILSNGNFDSVPTFPTDLYKEEPVLEKAIKSNLLNNENLIFSSNSGTSKNRKAQQVIETAQKIIAQAEDGEKHHALVKSSYLLGGYVAGNILNETEALNALKDAISKKEGVADIQLAYYTIEKCLENGKSSPLTIAESESFKKHLGTSKFTKGREYLNDKMIKRNLITGKLEKNDQSLTDLDINSLFIEMSDAGVDISKNKFDILTRSSDVISYNPLIDFFQHNNTQNSTGNITKLCQCLETDMDSSLKETLLKKWLVGMVAGIYPKNYNPLMLVLIGGKNIGKTEFFRRLLPSALLNYYAQSKLDAGKDSEALMCEKLLILNDELDALSKYEAKTFRNFISADQYTYRPPYGTQNVTKDRLATVCGSSNERHIIQDWENNRRIIPLEVKSINHSLYNSIDKVALFVELMNLYNTGYQWALTSENIKQLSEYSIDYRTVSIEGSLLETIFQPTGAEGPRAEFLTSTEILTVIESSTKQKLTLYNLGRELRQQGYNQSTRRQSGSTTPRKGYWVIRF